MKKKIGTVLEEEILGEAKARAALEHRALSELFQEGRAHGQLVCDLVAEGLQALGAFPSLIFIPVNQLHGFHGKSPR